MKGYAPYHLPDPLPPPDSASWSSAERYILERLASGVRGLRRDCALALHPVQAAAIELARSIHNGEVEPAEDCEGRRQPLPRVWRFEIEWRVVWCLEMPARHEVSRLVQWDREQRAA